MFHKSNPSNGLNMYSFCLFPEEHQPSSTCNFGKIDESKLIFEYDPIFIYKNNVINYDEYLKLISHDYINKIYDINIKFQHKITKEYITGDEYLIKYKIKNRVSQAVYTA